MPTRDRSSLYVRVQTKEQVMRFAQERGMTVDQAVQELLKSYVGNGSSKPQPAHVGEQSAPANGDQGEQPHTPSFEQPPGAMAAHASASSHQRRDAFWAMAISAAAVAALWIVLLMAFK